MGAREGREKKNQCVLLIFKKVRLREMKRGGRGSKKKKNTRDEDMCGGAGLSEHQGTNFAINQPDEPVDCNTPT